MKSKLLFLGFLFFNFILFSQTIQEKKLILKETNVSKLLKISKSKKTKFIEDKKLALSLAKIKGWQVFIEDSKGSFSELIKVDTERNPIYYSTYNYGAGLTARTNHLYTGGSLGLNIEGQNMIAGEWDGGAVLPTHELFEGRVTQMDGASSTHYHSTHVAGTIMGTDQVQGGNARGMAFKANLHAYEWNSDQAEVAQAAANGLLISNHSYGYNPGYLSLHQFGKYDSDANTFDDIMYNAPYYLFVAAAGNARDDGINSGDGGYDLLSGHSCTKNSIVVAAVQELTNYTGASSVNMSYFSSWGPTDDGRIKPDISAKGVDTFSASDNSDTDYITISGTSMASPSVTGTLLLMQQYYNQQNSQFMRSATLRGLALHTADEAGNNPGPDYEFGWGLINAKKAAEVIRDNGLLSHISEETLNQGASYSISFDALGSEPLKASICWTDPAGTIITNTVEDFYSPALVNDLDIRITQNGTTYYPWKLDPNNLSVAATQGDNIVDNIEKVEINNPVGLYTLTVTHKGNLQSGSQNFSVIVSGISFNDFYITSSNEKQNICEGDDIAQFNLDLSTISGFSDTVTFSTINLPAGVNASFSPIALNSAGNFTLDLTNLSGLATGVYPFIIHGQSSSDVADLNVELQVYDASFATQILSSPTNNATSIPLEVDLLWEDNLNAQQYLIQIATDIAFTNIIESSSISQNNYQTAILNNNTTYYWRVQPTNICGDGSFSSIYSFTTVCLEPTNVTTSNALLDSVDVSWTENSGGTNWEIEIVEAGNSPIGIGSLANTNPYTLTGLNSSTEYTVYVRSNCGNGNFSEWGVSAPFITAADFCSGDHFYDTGGASGSYSNNENTVTTIVPSIGFNTVSVQFNTFSLESCCDYLQIYNGSDTNAPLIGSYTYNPGTITSSNANGALTFLFHSDSSVIYDGWDATVTCINISCPAPTNLSSTNITLNSVDLSWIAGDTETDWEIEYGLAGFTQGTGIIEQIATNPYILSGLNSSTNYDVYLRANCGLNPGDDDSLWVGPINFTTLISCPVPTNLSSTNITLNSVDLSWIAGNTETAWEIEYGLAGFTQGTGTIEQIAINPYILSGLNSSTNYDVYLRANCGLNPGDDDSFWIGPMPFTTACDVIIAPFNENFTNYNIPNCWTQSGSEYWNFNTSADYAAANAGDHTLGGGTNYAWIDGSAPNGASQISTLITPIIDISSLSVPQVSFSIFSLNSSGNYYNTLDVEFYDGANWNTLLHLQESNGGWTDYNFVLTNYTIVGDVQLRFTIAENSLNQPYNNDILIDDISIDEAQTCPKPTEFLETNISPNSVDLSWTAGNTETDWEIEYGLAGFTQGTGTIEQIAINPYILSGLNSSTNYDVYLRANCGINPGDDDSLWVGPINFTTLVSCPAPTNLSSTNITLNSVDLSWIAGSTETAWEIEYGSSGFTQGTGTVVQTTTNPFTLTGLNASTNYDVYLRASCGTNPGDDDSLWIGPINFTTLVSCPTPTNFNSANTMVDSVDLSWTAGASETNWEIEYGLSGFMQGNGTVVQATTNPFTLTGLNQDTNYDVYLRANCGTNPEDDDSLWVGPINFTTYIDYCNGEHFYDSGGEFGNYSHGESIITTIIPTDGYNAVEVIFNSFEVSNFDTLRIYNGPDVNSTLLGVYNGGDFYHSDFPDSFISTHAAGALTFWFTSSSSVTEQGASGWDATVNCVNISCYDPTNFSSINETDTSVDLLWTAGNLETNWEIEYGIAGFIQGTGTAIQVNTNLHTISGLNQNTCYDVYLRSNCDDGSDSNWVKDSFITLKVEIPNNLTANINQSNGNVSLNWNETSYTLKEDFNDGYANGWQFERGPWYVHQGVYIGLHDGIAITSSYYPQVFSNYIMQFKMRKDGWHSSLGVYFNGDPSEYHGNGAWENTYSLEYCNYTSANWKLSKIVDGTWTTIKGWTDSNSLIAGPGVWNKVKIVSSNGYFDIYFNDVLNVSFYDDTFTDGVVGFMGASDNNAVNVDDFTLTELNCSYVFDNTNSTSNDAHTDRETQDFINYNIYRNGVIIATTSQTTYTETLPAYGTYNYYVSSVYDSGESNVSNTETVVWTNTASIDDLSQFNFKYHPNPFENTLTLSANQEFTSIKVYSLLGQELMDINLENQTNLTIDMSKLNVGTYFMKVEINNKSSSMKIIKK